MPTFAELAGVDPTAWLHQARAWDELAREVTERAERVRAVGVRMDRTWGGGDARAARQRRDALLGELTRAADRASAVAEVLGRHAGTVMAAQQRVRAAVLGANPLTTRVTEDGLVLPAPGLAAAPPGLPGSFTVYLSDARRIAAEIDAALADAARSDAETVEALHRLAPGGTDGPPPGSAAFPPDGTAPSAVHAWWQALPASERDRLVTEHPDRVGGLDGIPAADRDRANRLRLDSERTRLRRLRMRLGARPGGGAAAERDVLDATLAGIDVLEHRLAGAALLLAFDPTAGDAGGGLAVVAAGDPDRADNVVTYVPGVGARLAQVGVDLARADAIVAAARAADPHATTSAITWIGYRAPGGLLAAAGDGLARDGGAALSRFQDGLRATGRTGRTHLTVVGHSYGSLVAGHAAAAGGLQADDLVLVGSPGAGTPRGVADLGMDPSRVWATVAANDPINHVVGPPAAGTSAPLWPGRRLPFGLDPTDPSFGAQVFASAPGGDTPGTGAEPAPAHGQYWEPGSPSWESLGRIAVGRRDVVR